MLLTLLDLHNSSDDTRPHSVIVDNNNNYNNINCYCNKLPLSQDNGIITTIMLLPYSCFQSKMISLSLWVNHNQLALTKFGRQMTSIVMDNCRKRHSNKKFIWGCSCMLCWCVIPDFLLFYVEVCCEACYYLCHMEGHNKLLLLH